jgi:Tol biopolymer transport system component
MSDGKLFLFARRGGGILLTELRDGVWTPPEEAGFSLRGQDGDFTIAPDDQTVLFASGRPVEKGGPSLRDHNIWKTVRTSSGWKEPEWLAHPVNTDAHESYPSLSADGTLYFFSRREGGFGQSDIYLSEPVNGKYEQVINLGSIINTEHHEVDPFIAPDESYLILASDRPGGFGSDDFYICFKSSDGNWLPPMNMGEQINSRHTEYIVNVTLDGKYLFFTSDKNGSRDVFWVDREVIDVLKTKLLMQERKRGKP